MNPIIELSVLVLFFAPLAAAILTLTEKLFPETDSPYSGSRFFSAAAFLFWIGSSLWALMSSGPAVFSGQSILYLLGGWGEPLGISLELNGITWIACLTDVLIGSAAWLEFRRRKDSAPPTFYFFFFMTLFSLQGVLYTRDVFTLFIWFEVLSLSSFLLILHHGGAGPYRAAMRYLLMSTVSMTFYLVGVWILYRISGSLSLPRIAEAIGNRGPAGGISPAGASVAVAVACISAGILTRAAVFPFHNWLPEAHAAAPYPISALLSGFAIKAPVLALWRIFRYLPSGHVEGLLVWLGAACALIAVGAAMVQRDAKKLLGYHSVSQMGYIIAAFGFGGIIGHTAALLYIIAHALFKSLLFLTVGRVSEEAGSRDVYTLRGLGKAFPLSAGLFAVAALSISGVPLFAGYTAKLLVSEALHLHPAYPLLTAAGIGTAASFFKLSRIFTGPRNPGEVAHAAGGTGWRGSLVTAAALVLIAAGCILIGILPESTSRFFTVLSTDTMDAAGQAAAGQSPSFSSLFRGPPATAIRWFSWKALLKSALSIASGYLISRLLLSDRGKSISHRLRACGLGLSGSLRLLTAASLILIAASIVLG
jgi:formate hydrogenlyase subunit 3/multisubunit Na+/H+ antiporter MnhD subunit